VEKHLPDDKRRQQQRANGQLRGTYVCLFRLQAGLGLLFSLTWATNLWN
jgi:hypothetical protein